MPFTSRRYLAGVAALLGLCAAGVGCQSTSAQTNRFAIRTAPAGARPVAVAQPVAAPPRPVTPVAVVPTATPPREYQTPVPRAGADRAVVASTWQPLQRVSAEQVAGYPPGVTAQPIAQTPAPLTAVQGVSELPPAQLLQPTVPSEGAEGVETLPAPGCVADQPRLVPEPTVAAAVAAHPLHRPPVPREDAKQAFPEYRVEPPDILLIQASRAVTLAIQPIDGSHLVRPDGTISLGIYGTIFVAGLTLEEIRDAVAARLKAFRDQARAANVKVKDEKEKETDLPDLSVERIKLELTVDVLAYNSKLYYVITDGGGYGEQVYSFVATGNETVLDALAKINGLPAVASKKRIWLARATPDGMAPHILPVDWKAITQLGSAAANYQVFPGDRIYVNSDAKIRTDSFLAKTLAPVERVLGVTLLGSSTVNSIRTNPGRTGGTGTTVP
jgi:polysaccharide export outer membrane protein